MRERLYRGKRIETGEWVYGDLIQCGADSPWWYIMPNDVSGEMYEREPYPFRQNDVMCECAFAKVDPKTIGEITGLTDKNGKKIFEGDVVKTDSMDVCLSRGVPHVVEFDDKYSCGFVLKWKSVTQLFESVWKKSEVLEVIGNIHDNPELLEVNK